MMKKRKIDKERVENADSKIYLSIWGGNGHTLDAIHWCILMGDPVCAVIAGPINKANAEYLKEVKNTENNGTRWDTVVTYTTTRCFKKKQKTKDSYV